jgi:hypothetical protein
MSRLTHRLEHQLREVAAGAQPSPSAWESIVARLDEHPESEVAVELAAITDRSKRSRWPAAAAAALVVIAGSVAVLTSVGDDESITTAHLELTTTFVSPRNGFSVDYLDRGTGTVTPARQLWEFSRESHEVDDGFDAIETGSSAVFRGASTSLGLGVGFGSEGSIDERIDEFLSDDDQLPGGCGVPRRQQAEITIDGQAGRVAECPNHVEATVVVGGRLYLFTLEHDRSDARALFDAFVGTIDLTPETAVDFPAMTATFVSPTYGYSFEFFDRGGLAPATELWDPEDQPIEDRNLDERFDAVETGLLAYFEAASTPVPDGVSIDQWVDERITPVVAGGCGVARSRQGAVTGDRESTRLKSKHPNKSSFAFFF